MNSFAERCQDGAGLPDYRSEACGAIHETMEALREVGAIDKRTMREFDDACLAPVLPMPPDRIRALRERGVKKPGGPALRLLSVVEKKWNSGDCLSESS